MKKLVHPNIVQLVEVIDAPRDRSLYMVMEYAERGAVMRCVEPGTGLYECPVNGESLGVIARGAAELFLGREKGAGNAMGDQSNEGGLGRARKNTAPVRHLDQSWICIYEVRIYIYDKLSSQVLPADACARRALNVGFFRSVFGAVRCGMTNGIWFRSFGIWCGAVRHD